jgi:hypothetical protein
MAHFRGFGRVVELQLIVTAPDSAADGRPSQDKGADDNDGDKDRKSYNECLVQFATAQDAKKCLNSPTAVLNNRFIRVLYSTFNIVPLSDVPELTAAEIQEERAAAAAAKAAANAARYTKTGAAVPGGGANRRYSFTGPTASASASASGDADDSTADNAAPATPAVAVTTIKNNKWKNPALSAGEGAAASSSASASTVQAAPAPLTKEDLALQSQYEELRTLRQRAEGIFKQKEALLQVE